MPSQCCCNTALAPRPHRSYVILSNSSTMSILFPFFSSLKTGCMLYCLIPGQLECRSDFASSSPLLQEVCSRVWCLHHVDLTLLCFHCSPRMYVISFEIISQFWCNSAAASPCPQNVCCLVWSLENVNLTRFHLPQGVCDFVKWLNNADVTLWRAHRTYVFLFDLILRQCWSGSAAPTGSMLYCLIPRKCWFTSAWSSLLPQKVCYIVWLLDKVDFHHLSHSMYVILLNPCTMSNLIHHILVAQTGSVLYCLIPGQCRSDRAAFSLLQ